mmetsp:Transcript_36465/g.78814  ORF Transcript_36465/g.78814 Transcript_36465/m.78814 type:complete len:233 (-) Transcript_36465:98-796(-)
MGPRAFPKRGTFTIMPGLRVQAITRGLAAAGAKPQDIVFISDVDEIPHPATVAWSHTHDFNAPDQRLWAIQLRVMYYYLNTMHPAQFIPSCRVFPYSYIAEGGTIAAIRSISYRKINHKRKWVGLNTVTGPGGHWQLKAREVHVLAHVTVDDITVCNGWQVTPLAGTSRTLETGTRCGRRSPHTRIRNGTTTTGMTPTDSTKCGTSWWTRLGERSFQRVGRSYLWRHTCHNT